MWDKPRGRAEEGTAGFQRSLWYSWVSGADVTSIPLDKFMFIIYVRETLALEDNYIALWKVLNETAQPAINLFKLVGGNIRGTLCQTSSICMYVCLLTFHGKRGCGQRLDLRFSLYFF